MRVASRSPRSFDTFGKGIHLQCFIYIYFAALVEKPAKDWLPPVATEFCDRPARAAANGREKSGTTSFPAKRWPRLEAIEKPKRGLRQ